MTVPDQPQSGTAPFSPDMHAAIDQMRAELSPEILNGEDLNNDVEAAAVIQLFLDQHHTFIGEFNPLFFATWLPTRRYTPEFDSEGDYTSYPPSQSSVEGGR